MRKFVLIYCLNLAVAFFFSKPVFGQETTKLTDNLKNIISASEAPYAFWGIVVRDSTGRYLEKYHANKLFTPASNLKLLTSATILNELGPSYKFKTYMYGMGSLQDSVWVGNIIIRGSGDPSISGTFYDGYRLQVMHEFFAALDSIGIKKIDGNLIGNTSYFDTKPYPDTWMWNDLTNYYAPQINALSFNNNVIELTVSGNQPVGDRPTLSWFPFNTDYVQFVNEQLITPSNTWFDVHYRRYLGTNTILLSGYVPKGHSDRESLTVMNPARYFMDTYRKYLSNGGIDVTGRIIIDNRFHDWDSKTYKKLGVHVSPPLGDLIKHMNKESDNFYAEMFLKVAAAEHYGVQGTTELGIELAKNFLESLGADVSDIEMHDGSGLSASTLISPDAMSTLLLGVMDQPYFETYKESLPVGGVDGSLEYRFNNGELTGLVHAKTGYISSTRALSGYLTTQSNQTVVFSIFTNHYEQSTSYIDYVDKLILKYIYQKY